MFNFYHIMIYQTKLYENIIIEDKEEPLYATLKLPNKK